MKEPRYKIEKFEHKRSDAGWITMVDYGTSLETVKKRASILAKENPMWDLRIKAENGGVFWEFEFKK